MADVKQQGFTIPELLATLAVFIVLAGLAVFLLSPSTYPAEQHDAERRLEVAALVQAINRYAADTGELPLHIPDEPVYIGSFDDEYDICKLLTTEYLQRVPVDPETGVQTADEGQTQSKAHAPCGNAAVMYSTGYRIVRDAPASTATVSATLSNGKAFTLQTRSP